MEKNLTDDFFPYALGLLVLVALWNIVGRWLQRGKTDDGAPDTCGTRVAETLGAVVHVGVLSVVLFILMTLIIGGSIGNPTDFRYMGF